MSEKRLARIYPNAKLRLATVSLAAYIYYLEWRWLEAPPYYLYSQHKIWRGRYGRGKANNLGQFCIFKYIIKR
jgi:hypothetical protein